MTSWPRHNNASLRGKNLVSFLLNNRSEEVEEKKNIQSDRSVFPVPSVVYPAAQGIQGSFPVLSLKVPISHGLQLGPPEPGSQPAVIIETSNSCNSNFNTQ